MDNHYTFTTVLKEYRKPSRVVVLEHIEMPNKRFPFRIKSLTTHHFTSEKDAEKAFDKEVSRR